MFSFQSQAGKGNKSPFQQCQNRYYSTFRPTIKRKIAILRTSAEKQNALACVKHIGSNGQMLQIRLKTAIDRKQFRPVGKKGSKKPPGYGTGAKVAKRHTKEYNVRVFFAGVFSKPIEVLVR